MKNSNKKAKSQDQVYFSEKKDPVQVASKELASPSSQRRLSKSHSVERAAKSPHRGRHSSKSQLESDGGSTSPARSESRHPKESLSRKNSTKSKKASSKRNQSNSMDSLKGQMVTLANPDDIESAASVSRGRRSERSKVNQQDSLNQNNEPVHEEKELISEVDAMFKHLDLEAADFEKKIVQLNIYRTDSLISHALLKHPIVQVHLIDLNTGEYVAKSHSSRAVTRFNEGENINYILPIITKPFDLHHNHTKTPVWNESLILNEDYLHLILSHMQNYRNIFLI